MMVWSFMNDPGRRDLHRWQAVKPWLDRALDDLDMVDAAMGLASPSVYGVSLHCQQAAEKMAKAVLIAFGTKPPRTHDLVRLSRLVETVDAEIGAEIGALAQLTTWYAVARYPDAADALPSSQDIGTAVASLRALPRLVLALAPEAE
jgi:HEPN domain-containing protein